ncbi:MAG: deoxyguanosinetriphosphate triphosphohydrolase [Thermodesulfovibrionales bacterium]|nr:deoxyguanosinetriphosphate triphosphohydrolase [Thermodesulfovibrionales bacterium]
MDIREQTESIEARTLHKKAAKSSESMGRKRPERPEDLRTCFQRDRDRIIHSKAFRRLKHKTQVFLAPKGDHYRTRLTHVLEVSQIARTIARALRLNEDLTEAIALGHDLGHTPFGHAGEAVLSKIHPGGFKHYEQSLRVVDHLEKKGRGLNLSEEVRDGILKHSKGKGLIIPSTKADRAQTIEGLVVRVSDTIAYLNHDLDDSIRARVIGKGDIDPEVLKTLGSSHSKRINTMVRDFISTSLSDDLENLAMSKEISEAIEALRRFLYKHVYEGTKTKGEFSKAEKILEDIYDYYLDHPDDIKLMDIPAVEGEDTHRRVCDFVAGMTDRFAIQTYASLFMPMRWDAY